MIENLRDKTRSFNNETNLKLALIVFLTDRHLRPTFLMTNEKTLRLL